MMMLVAVLGCPVGTPEFVQAEVDKKIDLWCGKVKQLAEIAVTQPLLSL